MSTTHLRNTDHREPDQAPAGSSRHDQAGSFRGGLTPILRQASLALALAALVAGGLRLDDWARREAQGVGASSGPAFAAAGVAGVFGRPVPQSPPPAKLQANSAADPRGDAADPDVASSDHDGQAAETWLFLRLTGPDSKLHRFIRVHATGYTSCPTETNCMPHITAANTLTAPGTIALSRDLLRTFTPDAPFDFGDKVLIPGVGVFEVWDTMNDRWRRRADIWFREKEDAREWGLREVFLTLVTDDAPTMAYCPR